LLSIYLYFFELAEEGGLFFGVEQLLGGCHCETYYYICINSHAQSRLKERKKKEKEVNGNGKRDGRKDFFNGNQCFSKNGGI
jgi:hypothetical protein